MQDRAVEHAAGEVERLRTDPGEQQRGRGSPGASSISFRSGKVPAGPSYATRSPAHSRRRMSAVSASAAAVGGAMPYEPHRPAEPRPKPEHEPVAAQRLQRLPHRRQHHRVPRADVRDRPDQPHGAGDLAEGARRSTAGPWWRTARRGTRRPPRRPRAPAPARPPVGCRSARRAARTRRACSRARLLAGHRSDEYGSADVRSVSVPRRCRSWVGWDSCSRRPSEPHGPHRLEFTVARSADDQLSDVLAEFDRGRWRPTSRSRRSSITSCCESSTILPVDAAGVTLISAGIARTTSPRRTTTPYGSSSCRRPG